MKISANENLEQVIEKNWQRSFWNLLNVELGGWWKSKTWIWMTLLWVGVINGISALTFIGAEDTDPAALIFFYGFTNGLFPPIAVIIVLQESIVGEKKSGTASWILSKPVSRKIFIFSKWVGSSLNIFITMALIPGIVSFFEITLLTGRNFSFLSFLIVILLLGMNLIFYISFTLMLGTFQNSAGAVAAIPMVFNFTQQFLMSIPFVGYLLPTAIFLRPEGNPLIASIILGEDIFSILPIVITGALIILFLVIAFWRFEKEEF
ncbi:MAG: ABC transporter permease subunit [Candidatus Hodarchaeota archaeon]